MTFGYFLFLIVVLGFALCRFAIENKVPDFSLAGVFKVAAHFLVAGIVGYALGSGQWDLFCIAGALTGVEIVAFVTGEVHEEH